MARKIARRRFLAEVSAGAGAIAATRDTVATVTLTAEAERPAEALSPQPQAVVDFRYAPATFQTAFCFPDDSAKSLVGERGELRYGFDRTKGIHYFPRIFEFTLHGSGEDKVLKQQLESPRIPIVHTIIQRHKAEWELTTFATNRPGEGRVDNVLMEIRPRNGRAVEVMPRVIFKSTETVYLQRLPDAAVLRLENKTGPIMFIASLPVKGTVNFNKGGYWHTTLQTRYDFGHAIADREKPLRVFFRFPQAGQTSEQLKAGLGDPDGLLAEAREFWNKWLPLSVPVAWTLPGAYADFLMGCARNIQQAREVKNGKLTFQVGPTDYRGLWVVDGNFILEAGRYLGYDKEVREGLEATWAMQEESGGVFAGGGREHWKDTAIAIFTVVRQCELSQDWSYFKQMTPNIQRAVKFLVQLRDRAKQEPGGNGKYGLIARGVPDGGVGGLRSEFTNTLWTCAGLNALMLAAELQGMNAEFAEAKQFQAELGAALMVAARAEMRKHPAGFEFLPMVMAEDKEWTDPPERERLRLQTAQWAMSQAIYPGLVFERDSPFVDGHIRLMQACTQEDVPIETGWAPHESLWTYNAAFVAEMYLWAGLRDWARRTFIGFLNHASPLYCWREEQPLVNSVIGSYIGDMPHNWASAECVRYMRHMLALEDGTKLRLLAGITPADLAGGQPFGLEESPTRFGRVSLKLEPRNGGREWRLEYRRGSGPAPSQVEVPTMLDSLRFTDASGEKGQTRGDVIILPGNASSWTATWLKR